MQCITKRRIVQLVQVRLHLWVVLSLLVLALGGRMPDGQAGWLTCRPEVVSVAPAGRRRRARGDVAREGAGQNGERWLWLLHTESIALVRSLLVWALWQLSGQVGPAWLRLVPWGVWGWQSAGVLWPRLRCQPEWRGLHWLLGQAQSLLLVGYVSLSLGALLRFALSHPSVLGPRDGGAAAWGLGLGCVVCQRQENWVEAGPTEDGGYTATLCGHYTVHVAGDHPFRVRLLILFLRLLEVPGPQRGGRRTRDGRTPFVAQEKLATSFKVPQPDLSRWEKYWLAGDWANLLSQHTAEVLTRELMARIVTVFATFPWWRVEKVYQHLRGQGVSVSEPQVRQAAEQSGWSQLRQALVQVYQVTAEGIRPRDEWLTERLLAQVETLLAKLEAGVGLTPEEQVAVSDLRTLAAEVSLVAPPPLKALPWLMCVERVVFGHWEDVTDGTVRCIYCGSDHVVRKSRKPRVKRYYNAEGQLLTVEVYRYYCRNPECDRGSFTNLPPGLVPYSPYRTEVRLRALQMYAWGYSTYRRTGTALGVADMTTYRWVSAWGYALLPVAALFGVVKSSGVVGVDEKYVLVPKNDKPAGDMRRWMYVYLAVDVYTYDLLHIAIYPHCDKHSAHAFLLALRAKGYHPRVIVTDLRVDYGGVIAQVFPQAQHHECLFHAWKNVEEYVKAVYGAGYAQTHPEAEALKQHIYAISDAKTRRTAQKRYEAVLALREQYCNRPPPPRRFSTSWSGTGPSWSTASRAT